MIATIVENARRVIEYPKAIWDKDEERWISSAEVEAVHLT